MSDVTQGQSDKPKSESTWTIEIQRGLAWLIITVFALVIIGALLRTLISGDIDDINDTLKSALAVLFNIVMLVLGYFFGSSKSSADKDQVQGKLMDKLAPQPPSANDPKPPAGP